MRCCEKLLFRNMHGVFLKIFIFDCIFKLALLTIRWGYVFNFDIQYSRILEKSKKILFNNIPNLLY